MFSSQNSQVSSDANYIEDVFSTYLYTGNGSTQTITNGIDLTGKGGLTWVKKRSAAEDHFLVDSARGANYLSTNTTTAQGSQSVLSLGSSGFNLLLGNSLVNASGATYASWTFQEQPKFFDVVTYTGNGVAGRTIAHSLGSTPGMMIVKNLSIASNWRVYHQSLGATKYMYLNTTSAAFTGTSAWNDTAPTSTVFTVGNDSDVNNSGDQFVAYLFAHDAGGFGLTGTDNVISCGSFTTDGSGNATVSLGYEPQWVLVKRTNTVESWQIIDNMRGWPVTPVAGNYAKKLIPNSTAAEADTGEFPLTNTGFNATGIGASNTYIYIAIRRGPMKVPTSGTSVFAVDQGDGVTNPQFYAPFPQDSAIYRSVSVASNWAWFDRLRGQKNRLITNLTDAEGTFNVNMFDDMNRWFRGTTSTAYYSWMFRRAPSFMDVVCYLGTGANQTLSHNLQAVPELIIVKNRSGVRDWGTGWASIGWGGRGPALNSNEIAYTSVPTWWNSTAPTASAFTVGSSATTNGSGSNFVAYLFATCAGVSKVGSYTGTGTTKQVDCGFTGGARFVLIKRTDSTGDWYVWDSARGIVSGNDPYLLMNSSAAEVTSTDYIDTYSAGFEISSTAPAAINASGGTFIFLAIA